MKDELIKTMTQQLEEMCTHLTSSDTHLFHYCAGRADALRELLEKYYNWDERYADDHIKAMWDIMDENWCW